MWKRGLLSDGQGEAFATVEASAPETRLIENTLKHFLESEFAPVAFISFDVDLYTSTRQALAVFEGTPNKVIPRVSCYFDDIMGFGCNEYTGERLAIEEFNRDHIHHKVTQNHGLQWFVPWRNQRDRWVQQMFIAHMFDHPRYCAPARENIDNVLDINGNYRRDN